MKPEDMKRREQIVQMRRARLSFAEIGRRLGITGQRAGQLYRSALAEVPRQAVEEHRIEEAELVDTAVNKLMALAADATVTPRTRVEAWVAIRGWADRKAKLLALDAERAPETGAVVARSMLGALAAGLQVAYDQLPESLDGGD